MHANYIFFIHLTLDGLLYWIYYLAFCLFWVISSQLVWIKWSAYFKICTHFLDSWHVWQYLHEFPTVHIVSFIITFYWFFVDFKSWILIPLIFLSEHVHSVHVTPSTSKTKFKSRRKTTQKRKQKNLSLETSV